MIICKNCSHAFEGKFCNHCGQSAKTKRINHEFLWEDIEHGLLHYDKGIGYSLKRLFKKPGHEIRNYIAGKRVNHFRPISMVIILATVYALIYHFLDLNKVSTISETSSLFLEKIFEHYYYYVVASIPVYAATTYLLFKKTGYNFYEFIIFEAFKTSQRLTVHIFLLPALYFLKNKEGFGLMNNLLMVIDFILIVWVNRQFFNKLSFRTVFLKSLFAYMLYILIISLLVVAVLVIG